MQPPLSLRTQETQAQEGLCDFAFDDDSEDDSDYTPDSLDSDNESLPDNECLPDMTCSSPAYKRKREEKDTFDVTSRSLCENEKKAKVDALWQEMNLPRTPSLKSTMSVHRTPENSLSSPPTPTPAAAAATLSVQSPSPLFSSVSSSSSSPPLPPIPCHKKRVSTVLRPKSELSDLVSRYNIKVPKMNTLEKSRLDWQGYVDREGIREDLRYQNKDGYMEKVAFLQRVDDRRFLQLKTGQRLSKK
ncbi:bucentaur or craniofacial development-domain-containing protein [Spinellus fusiger]|nr:bucentaur or craniofacial development-domain-containing protein [Spinellus fusiger]